MSDILLTTVAQKRAEQAIENVKAIFNKAKEEGQEFTEKGIQDVYETEFMLVFMSGSRFESERQAIWAIKDTNEQVGIDSNPCAEIVTRDLCPSTHRDPKN